MTRVHARRRRRLREPCRLVQSLVQGAIGFQLLLRGGQRLPFGPPHLPRERLDLAFELRLARLDDRLSSSAAEIASSSARRSCSSASLRT